MNKQEIKAIFLAHGFQERLQADGSMDLNPYVYEAAEALLERFWIDTSNPVSLVRIKPRGDAPARTGTLYHGRQHDPEIPVFVLKGAH